jgi:AAA family ATPase
MTRNFQEVCGFKLSDELKISAAGPLRMAESIILKDITSFDTFSELKDEEKHVWDWPLRESFCK